jgi:basic amino acid/polyamine antiporter, APA family
MAELKRTLNVTDLTFLFVGMVIGSGIFLTPGAVLVHAGGTIAPAMLAWLAGGILSLLGALTYAELSTMKPQAGGFYVFIRDCYGDFPAYMFGWTLFAVVATGSIATLAVAFAKYLGQLTSLTASGEKLAAVGMVAAVGALNVWGTRKSANTTNWATAIKASAILVMSVAVLVAG